MIILHYDDGDFHDDDGGYHDDHVGVDDVEEGCDGVNGFLSRPSKTKPIGYHHSEHWPWKGILRCWCWW